MLYKLISLSSKKVLFVVPTKVNNFLLVMKVVDILIIERKILLAFKVFKINKKTVKVKKLAVKC